MAEAAGMTLEPGDFLPDFQLLNQRRNPTVVANKMLGKAGVFLFYPDHDKAACQEILRGFAERHAELDALAHVFAVTRESPEVSAAKAQSLGLPFGFILADAEGRIAQGLGVAHNLDQGTDFMGLGAFTVFVTDANRRLLRIDRGVQDKAYAAGLIDFLAAQPRREPQLMGPTAPVLYVPQVFTPADCRRLIEVYETQGNQPTGSQIDDASGQAAQRFDPSSKIRRDHTVTDRALNAEIRETIGRRVIPEIFKAFHYRATHYEVFKISCYDGADKGFFRPHRDNVSTSTAHRRFAMTVNLNTGDYAGGQLRFPEYGPELYAPAAGDAVVFSCSLLHEATPVTEGRRFALLAFFYGAESQGLMRQRQAATPG